MAQLALDFLVSMESERISRSPAVGGSWGFPKIGDPNIAYLVGSLL